MNNDKRSGDDTAPVDPERRMAGNAFDGDDEYSGQQYTPEREAAQARIDRADDTPHDRSRPEHLPPEDPGVVGLG